MGLELNLSNRKKTMRFFSSLIFVAAFFVFIFSASPLRAQRSPQADIQMTNPYSLYLDLNKAFLENLPQFQQQLESILKDFNKGKAPETLQWVKGVLNNLDVLIDKIRPDPNFDQIEASFDKMKATLRQAEAALQKKNIAAAKKALQRADIMAKVFVESPVMKMTQAQIDLDQASRQIAQKDYVAAGMFINQALEHIQGINADNNPKLASALGSIKSDLVILHQQAIIGKAQDESKGRSIWQHMQQTQANSMSYYYDMWSSTYHPWDFN